MRRTLAVVGVVLFSTTVVAQESPNYALTDYSFGSGGAFALESPAYRMTLVTTGELATGEGLTSESYSAGGGIAACYPPPGETEELRFTDAVSLAWAYEASAGVYNVYREALSSLARPSYGGCLVAGIVSATTSDLDIPSTGDGFFYLVTAENRLAEEGPLGPDSSSVERPNLNPCN